MGVACRRLVAVGAVGPWKRVAAVGQTSNPCPGRTRRKRTLAALDQQPQRVRISTRLSNPSIGRSPGLGAAGTIRSGDPRAAGAIRSARSDPSGAASPQPSQIQRYSRASNTIQSRASRQRIRGAPFRCASRSRTSRCAIQSPTSRCATHPLALQGSTATREASTARRGSTSASSL